MTDEVRRRVCVGAWVAATALVDGTVAAMWSVARADGRATMTVEPFRPLAPADRDAVEAEAHRLMVFTDPAADRRDVQLLPGS
jgi:hypothetical protein